MRNSLVQEPQYWYIDNTRREDNCFPEIKEDCNIFQEDEILLLEQQLLDEDSIDKFL